MAAPTVLFEKKQDELSPALDELTTRASGMAAFFKTRIFPMYLNAQRSRWQTENSSEGAQWKNYREGSTGRYASYKRKKWASAPGGGEKMMMASAKLFQVVTAEQSGLNQLFESTKMVLAVDDGAVPYAKFAAAERPFMEFGDDTIQKMRDAISAFIKTGRAL